MRPCPYHPEPAPNCDANAFEIWFGQTLKQVYEPVLHEPLPHALLDCLPAPMPAD